MYCTGYMHVFMYEGCALSWSDFEERKEGGRAKVGGLGSGVM